MIFSLDKILENNQNEYYKKYSNIKKNIKRVNVWENDFIVYSCGFVFKLDKRCKNGKWKLLNLIKKNIYGYIPITLRNKKKQIKMFRLHRIVYLAFHQDGFDIYNSSNDNSIDHINGNKVDNRISNLRNVTHQHNQFNTKAKGYSFNKQTNKYKAQIMIDGKRKHLGYFKTKIGAKLKYLRTKDVFHKIIELHS